MVADIALKIGVARCTLNSWCTNGTSARQPEPRHLQALLDEVKATADQRAEAWRLLAAADKERAERAKDQTNSNRPVAIEQAAA